MIQRIRRSRLLPSLVAALAAATMAGGVASAVTEAKADDETITMCVSALGTKIRFVHTSADCNAGELVRTWNTEGPAGARGARGSRGVAGATGPTGPSGPAGAAGAAASTFSGGQVVDAAQAVVWYVATGVTAGSTTLATSTFTVPSTTRQYFVYWTAAETIPTAAEGCATDATSSAAAMQVVVNGVVTAVTEATMTPVVLAAGTNSVLVRALQGVCTGAVDAGATNNVTLARLSVIMG